MKMKKPSTFQYDGFLDFITLRVKRQALCVKLSKTKGPVRS